MRGKWRLLFHLEQAWKEEEISNCFGVTMGRYDGAELFKLTGIFTQLILQDIINKETMGLYKDDGHVVLNKINSQKAAKIRKTIIQVFKDNGFSFEIMINLVEFNFSDVTFNLRNVSYQPYKKRNDELKYINVFSNHPPHILKQITTTISDTFSRNSSGEFFFNESKHQYEDTLKKVVLKLKLLIKTHQHLLTEN